MNFVQIVLLELSKTCQLFIAVMRYQHAWQQSWTVWMCLKMTEKIMQCTILRNILFLQGAPETVTNYAILKFYNNFATTCSKKVLTSCWNLSQGVKDTLPFWWKNVNCSRIATKVMVKPKLISYDWYTNMNRVHIIVLESRRVFYNPDMRTNDTKHK